MAFKGTQHYDHQRPQRIGVLITNLGTPDAPTSAALRRYLKEFLSDPRVVEVPRLLWFFILRLVILVIRPPRSAAAYRKVWTEQGSPLLLHTRDQAEGLSERLRAHYGDDLVVEFAMRYGQPSISAALQKLEDQGVRRLLVLPLYPQYSASTNASTFDALAADFAGRRWLPDLRFISHYPDYWPYIDAMARHIEAYWQSHGRAGKLLFSFHGVPKRYLLNGDPYFCECHQSARLLAERLGLQDDDWQVTFQSRFGREEWLQPYTDHTLKALPGQGVKSVQVFCPGFSADCLETLEEIDEENRGYFLAAGGEQFAYIPALNAEPVHLDALAQLVEDNLQGWERPDNSPAVRQARAKRASKAG
ncbi:ferrochelatase [Alcanivorax hongdengensis A-11-3]|uniref:Ferrochelatase n=1 Tax=Alcanivorax hongdengensis A-11-3 TaxID=1177179 RepID=L0WIT3_9GAMM|nr:ferrochelatase [Alcanivorax hongdengensis]EKF76082.1 ferrochelatase [Alcanivorax hongdengensis A-11-3]